MRAIYFDQRLSYREAYADPVPGEREALVKVQLAGICATDIQITRGYMNFRGVLGHEFVGSVVHGSRNWRGKRVVSEINVVCRRCDMCQAGLATHCRKRTVLGIDGHDGCFADFVNVPEVNLHEVPASISDEEAVFVEPLAAAYQVVKQCKFEPRTSAAVVGSGKLGLLVAQVLATTGCRLVVIGRNPHTLTFCDRKRIQAVSVDQLVPRRDQDVVVECSGAPRGLGIALEMVRPRGTIVLKSTYAGGGQIDLAPAVIHEVTILGSRCGPFAEAINALVRRQIDVSSMITRSFRIDRGLEAFEAAQAPEVIKVLLKINPR
jgi:alcohol dehydrogenase